jgi:DNA gyrase inhibitor GyrI
MALCTDDVDHHRYYTPYGYRELAFGMNKNVSKEKMEVILKKMPSFHVAYVRHVGAHDSELIDDAFLKLFAWAEPRGFITADALLLGVIWDSPVVAPTAKLKLDAYITILKKAKGLDGFPVQEIPGGLFAVHSCTVCDKHFEEPWFRFLVSGCPRAAIHGAEISRGSIFYTIMGMSTQSKNGL